MSAPTPEGVQEGVAKLSVEEREKKNEAKKAAKEAERAAKAAKEAERAAQREAKQTVMMQPDPEDPLRERYGDLPMIQSSHTSGSAFVDIAQLDASWVGKEVLFRARMHNIRSKGKSAFLVLRQRTATVQAILFANDSTVSKGMVKYASQIPRESIVDVMGTVGAVKEPIISCSQTDVEVECTGIKVVSRAALLPFEIVDASRCEADVKAAADRGEVLPTVDQVNRLNSRFLDLRTPANQAIFKIQSGVCQLFKDCLLKQGFQEIHTPKIIAGSSEGGAAVFQVDYMGLEACLAQSPQLYKQMAICADFNRVFEIGPVFRAENSWTHRHLCEFMGLDFEMAINEHYFEVLDVVEHMFDAIFNGLAQQYAREIQVVGQQFPCEPARFKRLRMTFAEAVQMLKENGYPDINPLDDLNTEQERSLGKLVQAKHETDFYIIHRYPLGVRPFYTMPCADDPQLSNSFDVFIRGEEIISGAQRIHSAELLEARAQACGIPVDSIRAYLDSFKFGAPPHGGVGVGLERVVMLYLGLDNIRKTSMFPRDPKRIMP